MRNILLFLTSLFVLSGPLCAQDNEENYKSLEFHTMPFTLLDLSPRFRLGAEYRITQRFSCVLDCGFGNNDLNGWVLRETVWKNDYSFIEVRPELKYYFPKADDITSFYVATELFYIRTNSILKDGYYHPENQPFVICYELATFNRQKAGLHIKGGVTLSFSRFDFDFYGGLGIASREINYSHITNPETEEEDIFFEEGFNNSYKYEGGSILPHLTLGCKIGMVLWKD